jgi:hypothetical protein
MVEGIGYTPARAVRFGLPATPASRRFISASGPTVGDPQFDIKLMDDCYGNRMGNGPASRHDGSNYVGRGLSQCSGKDGYAAAAKKSGLDVHPELFSSPAASRFAYDHPADGQRGTLDHCAPYQRVFRQVHRIAYLNKVLTGQWLRKTGLTGAVG